jgi:hypothetical protein
VPGIVTGVRFYPLSSGDTVATTSNLSVTEIDQTGVSVLSSGSPLPAPIVLGPDAAPAAYAPDLGGQNIETTQITPSRSALDFYESIEGMRVEVDNARVVGPSDTVGEEYITTKPAQNASFRGGTLLQGENATPSGRPEIVAADGSNPEGQPGGNIRVVFLFNPAVVSFLDTGEFTFKGNDVFVIASHFDARLGDQNADGRYQYPAQSSAVQRSGQALAEHRFVSQILAIDKKDDFDGVSEVLDHILVSNGIKKFTYQVVHLNSEYANQVSDHDPQVVDIRP